MKAAATPRGASLETPPSFSSPSRLGRPHPSPRQLWSCGQTPPVGEASQFTPAFLWFHTRGWPRPELRGSPTEVMSAITGAARLADGPAPPPLSCSLWLGGRHPSPAAVARPFDQQISVPVLAASCEALREAGSRSPCAVALLLTAAAGQRSAGSIGRAAPRAMGAPPPLLLRRMSNQFTTKHSNFSEPSRPLKSPYLH